MDIFMCSFVDIRSCTLVHELRHRNPVLASNLLKNAVTRRTHEDLDAFHSNTPRGVLAQITLRRNDNWHHRMQFGEQIMGSFAHKHLCHQ